MNPRLFDSMIKELEQNKIDKLTLLNALTVQQLTKLQKTLQRNHSLNTLSINELQIIEYREAPGQHFNNIIAGVLGKPKSLITEFKENSNDLVIGLVLDLARKSYSKLKSLNLNKIGMNDSQIAKLSDAFLNIEKLYLHYMDINDKQIGKICEALKKNKNLQILDLEGNCITETGASSVAEVLIACPNLNTLSLSNNELKSAGAKLIAAACNSHPNLYCLSLSGNQIDMEAEEALGNLIQDNKTLKKLILSENNLERTPHIAEALKCNSSLQGLYLAGNKLDDDACKSLIEALMLNVSMAVLLFGENVLDETSAKRKSALIAKNKEFQNEIKVKNIDNIFNVMSVLRKYLEAKLNLDLAPDQGDAKKLAQIDPPSLKDIATNKLLSMAKSEFGKTEKGIKAANEYFSVLMPAELATPLARANKIASSIECFRFFSPSENNYQEEQDLIPEENKAWQVGF